VTLVIYKAIAAIIVFLISAAIIFPLKKKQLFRQAEFIDLGDALASGIFLGAAFFHMLPDAIKTFGMIYGNNTYPIPEAVCIAGFLLFLFLERLSLSNLLHSKNSIPYVVAIILVIHALIEGMALGIGETFSEAVMLFVAIVAHKGSESFALSIILVRYRLPFNQIVGIVLAFAAMTPLGIGFGTAINSLSIIEHGELAAAIFNAFAAGTFLYISTLHHIQFHKHTKESQGMGGFACLALGLVTMGVLALWV